MYGQSRILLVLHIPLSPSSVTVRRCVPRRKLFDSHSAWVGSWSLWGSLCFILRFFWWCPLASLCPLRCLKGLHVGTSRLGLFFAPSNKIAEKLETISISFSGRCQTLCLNVMSKKVRRQCQKPILFKLFVSVHVFYVPTKKTLDEWEKGKIACKGDCRSMRSKKSRHRQQKSHQSAWRVGITLSNAISSTC